LGVRPHVEVVVVPLDTMQNNTRAQKKNTMVTIRCDNQHDGCHSAVA
jgi:hypothetical protein